MTASSLPLDIWLLVFAQIEVDRNVHNYINPDNLTVLWCIVRNVSSHLRDCIDEYFRCKVLHRTLVDLHYSSLNHHCGPAFAHLHVPLRFSHLSSDGTRAVFRQMSYNGRSSGRVVGGSIRGWILFVERYCTEALKPKPQVTYEEGAEGATWPPAWVTEHLNLRNTLAGDNKSNYLSALRDHTSIGRGYRPPYFLKIRGAVRDTELVALAVNCETREISFDWRRSFALFFTEERFIMLAECNPGKQHMHDPDLVAAVARAETSRKYDWAEMILRMYSFHETDDRRARRKRLQPWLATNKHRMIPEDRLEAEDQVQHTKHQVNRDLRHDNLRELVPADLEQDKEEVVPEKCAEDLPYLLWWPCAHDDTYVAPREPLTIQREPRKCSVM